MAQLGGLRQRTLGLSSRMTAGPAFTAQSMEGQAWHVAAQQERLGLSRQAAEGLREPRCQWSAASKGAGCRAVKKSSMQARQLSSGWRVMEGQRLPACVAL